MSLKSLIHAEKKKKKHIGNYQSKEKGKKKPSIENFEVQTFEVARCAMKMLTKHLQV